MVLRCVEFGYLHELVFHRSNQDTLWLEKTLEVVQTGSIDRCTDIDAIEPKSGLAFLRVNLERVARVDLNLADTLGIIKTLLPIVDRFLAMCHNFFADLHTYMDGWVVLTLGAMVMKRFACRISVNLQ